MRSRAVHIVLWLLIGAGPVSAQEWIGTASPHERGWRLSTSTAYHTGIGASYAGARIGTAFTGERIRVGIFARLNEQLNFTFAPRDLIVYVDDPSVTFSEGTELSARADRYAVSIPAEGHAALRVPFGEVIGHLSLLTQETRLELPSAQQTADGVYLINWTSEQHRQTRLTAAVMARIRIRSTDVVGGLLGIPALAIGDSGFRYAFRPRMTPYLGVRLDVGSGTLGAGTTASLATLSYRHMLQSRWRRAPAGPAAAFAYRAGLDGHGYHMLRLDVDVPFTPAIRGVAGISRSWSDGRLRGASGFESWQRMLIPGLAEDAGHGLPYMSFRAGIQLTLGATRPISPIELWDVVLERDRLFTAVRRRLADAPIGHLRLYNSSDRPATVRLLVETTETGGRYRSTPFALDPAEERLVPLFLYPGDPTETRHEQLVIRAETSDGATAETSVPIITYGRNAWDGDTQHLRDFLTPEHPGIRRHARELYLDSAPEAIDPASPARRFRQLQDFLAALGRDIAYVEDPTTTAEIDHVQYPIETLRDGRGDCEDLTVYLASALMAVGVATAILDVRPESARVATGSMARVRQGVGHVFLLVDTGIRPADSHALGLNEFQTITRTGASGDPTIWIPIETSVLDRGFEAAFREGVRQYAEAAFGSTGTANVALYVVDL